MTTHWPRTPVSIGGKRFELCFTLGAVSAVQHAFDLRGTEVNLLDTLPPLNLANVRLMLPFTLQKYQPGFALNVPLGWHEVHDVAAALRAAWRDAAPVAEDGKRAQKHKQHPKKETLSRDQQWQRLWSLAVYDLRLSTEAFYALTVGQLDALLRRREREIQEREFMPAQIAACIVNSSMGRAAEGVSAKDFMPSQWEKVPERKKMRSRKVIAEEVRLVMEEAMRYQNRQR